MTLWRRRCTVICAACLQSAFTSETTKCCSTTHAATWSAPSRRASTPSWTYGWECRTDSSPVFANSTLLDRHSTPSGPSRPSGYFKNEQAFANRENDMSGKLNVLVTGATGKQGGHLVRELLARGHSIRALTRKPESPAAAALAARGVTIVSGDFDDQGSLERAARGVDTVFAMSTPFESGAKTETREGVNIVRAASAVGVPHLVYASVAGADRRQAFRISTASSRSRTR